MGQPPRQPPRSAPVAAPGTRPPNAPAATPPTATPTPTPTAPPTPQTPPQGEGEGAANNGGSGSLQTRAQLERAWNEDLVMSQIISGNHFQPNASNFYNNLTYHWRLFCMPDRDFVYENGVPTNIREFYQRIDAYKQITIAQSGVTGFNISEVEMTSVFGDTQSRGSQFTEITMKINEPNGVQFMDALQQAATEAGIHNYIDFFYYLELTFKGYDENGDINVTPFAGELPNDGRWIWCVRINDIEVNLNSGGGQYKLTMVPSDEHALDREYSAAVDTMIVKGETVGAFFDELARHMNHSWCRRLAIDSKANTQEQYITHEFKVHGIPGTGLEYRDPASVPLVSGDLTQSVQVLQQVAELRAQGRIEEANRIERSYQEQVSQGNERLREERRNAELSEIMSRGIPAEEIRGMTLKPQDENWNNIRTHQAFAFVDPNHSLTTTTATATQEAGQARPEEEVAPTDVPDIPTASIGRGTAIVDIINHIMGCTESAQSLGLNSGTAPQVVDTSDDGLSGTSAFRECVTWQIIPEVRFDKTGRFKYDFFTNRYGRTIVWHIYPRIDQEPILSDVQVRNAYDPQTGLQTQRGLLSALAARGFLPKKYDYLFTGLNTEVLNFDLNFNFAWSVMLPRFQSYYHDQNIQHERVNALSLLDQLDAQTDSESSDVRARWDEHRRRYNEDAEGRRTPTGEEEPPAEGEEESAEDRQHREDHDRLNAESQAVNRLAAQRERARALAIQARRNAEETAQRIFGNTMNVEVEQDYSREWIENVLHYRHSDNTERRTNSLPLVPFSFLGGDEARHEAGYGGTGQWHNGRQLYGAILNQTYGPTTGRFQQIELTVRGDPFWIGYGSFEKKIQHNHETVIDHKRLAYHFIGQNCFIFRFKYPSEDEAGNIKLSNNETVTGVYKVNRIKTSFRGGQWTHVLEAVRLPLIDLFTSVFGLRVSEEEEAARSDESTDPAIRAIERDAQQAANDLERVRNPPPPTEPGEEAEE